MIIIIISFSNAKQKYFIMLSTGYCPCELCCEKYSLNGLTFTGDKAGKGCIAIDKEAGILKLGQKVYVEGYGEGICNDIGGAIKGYEIDLCFDTHQEALNWGIRLVKVYIQEGK
jgi:3D (Asp-Asp-Asp) domain-containing protein